MENSSEMNKIEVDGALDSERSDVIECSDQQNVTTKKFESLEISTNEIENTDEQSETSDHQYFQMPPLNNQSAKKLKELSDMILPDVYNILVSGNLSFGEFDEMVTTKVDELMTKQFGLKMPKDESKTLAALNKKQLALKKTHAKLEVMVADLNKTLKNLDEPTRTKDAQTQTSFSNVKSESVAKKYTAPSTNTKSNKNIVKIEKTNTAQCSTQKSESVAKKYTAPSTNTKSNKNIVKIEKTNTAQCSTQTQNISSQAMSNGTVIILPNGGQIIPVKCFPIYTVPVIPPDTTISGTTLMKPVPAGIPINHDLVPLPSILPQITIAPKTKTRKIAKRISKVSEVVAPKSPKRTSLEVIDLLSPEPNKNQPSTSAEELMIPTLMKSGETSEGPAAVISSEDDPLPDSTEFIKLTSNPLEENQPSTSAESTSDRTSEGPAVISPEDSLPDSSESIGLISPSPLEDNDADYDDVIPSTKIPAPKLKVSDAQTSEGSAVIPPEDSLPDSSESTRLITPNPPGDKDAAYDDIPSTKLPTPILKISDAQTSEDVHLIWDIETDEVKSIKCFQVACCCENSDLSLNDDKWEIVGIVEIMPLPISCLLKKKTRNIKCQYKVRALDIHGHAGPYSLPVSVIIN